LPHVLLTIVAGFSTPPRVFCYCLRSFLLELHFPWRLLFASTIVAGPRGYAI